MSKTDWALMTAGTLLLLAVNWLAFHDFAEVHTVRDWMVLVASVAVFAHFAMDLGERNAQRG
jgi:hypothetical protein